MSNLVPRVSLLCLPCLLNDKVDKGGREERPWEKSCPILDHIFSKVKWLPIFDLMKLRKLVFLCTILNNPDAPLCKFHFLSSVRSTGLRTRACAFNLQVPYPSSNSGKRTFAYPAATLFNCLIDTNFKQIACVPLSSIIFSSRLNNFKQKLFLFP